MGVHLSGRPGVGTRMVGMNRKDPGGPFLALWLILIEPTSGKHEEKAANEQQDPMRVPNGGEGLFHDVCFSCWTMTLQR